MGAEGVPTCCRECRYFSWDLDEYRDVVGYFCELGVWFPIKKQKCSRLRGSRIKI